MKPDTTDSDRSPVAITKCGFCGRDLSPPLYPHISQESLFADGSLAVLCGKGDCGRTKDDIGQRPKIPSRVGRKGWMNWFRRKHRIQSKARTAVDVHILAVRGLVRRYADVLQRLQETKVGEWVEIAFPSEEEARTFMPGMGSRRREMPWIGRARRRGRTVYLERRPDDYIEPWVLEEVQDRK